MNVSAKLHHVAATPRAPAAESAATATRVVAAPLPTRGWDSLQAEANHSADTPPLETWRPKTWRSTLLDWRLWARVTAKILSAPRAMSPVLTFLRSLPGLVKIAQKAVETVPMMLVITTVTAVVTALGWYLVPIVSAAYLAACVGAYLYENHRELGRGRNVYEQAVNLFVVLHDATHPGGLGGARRHLTDGEIRDVVREHAQLGDEVVDRLCATYRQEMATRPAEAVPSLVAVLRAALVSEGEGPDHFVENPYVTPRRESALWAAKKLRSRGFFVEASNYEASILASGAATGNPDRLAAMAGLVDAAAARAGQLGAANVAGASEACALAAWAAGELYGAPAGGEPGDAAAALRQQAFWVSRYAQARRSYAGQAAGGPAVAGHAHDEILRGLPADFPRQPPGRDSLQPLHAELAVLQHLLTPSAPVGEGLAAACEISAWANCVAAATTTDAAARGAHLACAAALTPSRARRLHLQYRAHKATGGDGTSQRYTDLLRILPTHAGLHHALGRRRLQAWAGREEAVVPVAARLARAVILRPDKAAYAATLSDFLRGPASPPNSLMARAADAIAAAERDAPPLGGA